MVWPSPLTSRGIHVPSSVSMSIERSDTSDRSGFFFDVSACAWISAAERRERARIAIVDRRIVRSVYEELSPQGTQTTQRKAISWVRHLTLCTLNAVTPLRTLRLLW